MPSSPSRPCLAAARWLLLMSLLLPLLPAPASVLAQAPTCAPETEPNNTEAEVEPVAGELCVAGDLPDVADQDLFLWTVTDEDAAFRWTVTVDGPDGAVTSAKVLTVASEPGVEPVVAGVQIADLSESATADAPAVATFLFSPGRYLVGVSRTATAEGAEPLTTTYELSLAHGDPLPSPLDEEPNDDAGSASTLPATFATSGDTLDSVDAYAWTLSEEDAALGWELHLLAALGQAITLTVTGEASGDPLVTATTDPLGRIDLYDLALAPGTYGLTVGPAAVVPTPYTLASATGERPVDDLEPNDQAASAAVIDLANPVRKGRLAGTADVDLFRLTVDAELAGSLFNLRLVSRGAEARELCIAAVDTGEDLQCKEGVGGAALGNILLPRGEYLIRVSGPPDPTDPYLLRLDVTSAPRGDFESEPNDSVALAAPLDPAVPIQGRFDGDETDAFRFTTVGEPQLWEVTVAGAGITGLGFTRRDGTDLAAGAVAPDGTSARLSDLYLPPGDHWLSVQGRDGEYTVGLTPLGPPPVDGEREANNILTLAEPMSLGETRTGRLVETTDRDVFRFSLAATEHVLLTLTPPEDAEIAVTVDWGSSRVGSGTSSAPGEAISLDLTLLAGDYVVSLTPNELSEGRYALALARGDLFQVVDDEEVAGDREPNNDAASANPLPAGAEVAGSLPDGDTRDVYAIAPAEGRDLTFVIVSDGAYISLTDEVDLHPMVQTTDLTVWTVEQPVADDIPLFLEVVGFGDYVLTYAPTASATDEGPDLPGVFGDDGPDLPGVFGDDEPASPVAEPDPAAPAPLDLSLALDVTEIAAFWHEGQVVAGTLTIVNPSGDRIDLELGSATTHFLFSVDMESPPTQIEAGASLGVPITVTVQPDAWAGIPVRVTLAAIVDGLPALASADITPTADTLPVAPFQAWPLPAELRGGLDLSGPALGAVPAGTVDLAQEASLHDGVAPIGSGLIVNAPFLPIPLTVDLAGDALAPVAGVTVHPQPTDGIPQHQVRAFELLLSTDGVTFATALTGELSPLAREQFFVLPKPVEATHAQLLILTTYGDPPTQPAAVSLGEWTVVATPGFVPDTLSEIDVASAAFGGHIVRWSPQPPSQDVGVALLSPDEPGAPIQTLNQIESGTAEWVVAFQDNRAARITELRWVDHPESVEANRLTEVVVEVAIASPSGPWSPLAEWSLERDAEGAVAPLTLDEPTWARYVRFSGTLGDDAIVLEYPAQLSIIEAPVSDDYRSVTGVWGATSPLASFEVQNPPPGGTVPETVDAPNDRADAAELALGDAVTGYAQIGRDVDWYRVVAGEGDNTLTFTLTAVPIVDVVVRVYAAGDGAAVEVARAVGDDASTVVYTAPATPAAAYDVIVQQPPHSIVFAFDTSISLANYQPFVQQSLRSFASGVREGQEFVQLIPFDEQPLLETWTDDSYLVVSAINGYYDKTLSSSVETGVLDATTLLAEQEGATAILVVTDAETGSYAVGEKMWSALDVTRPRVFSVHIGGGSTPVLNEQLLQDLSAAGGHYQYTSSQAEMDRAFDRAATWLRRPTAYSLTVASSFQEATPTPEPTAAATATAAATPTAESTEEPTATPTPTEEPEALEPGSIAVVGVEPGDDGPAAEISNQVTIEIVFDTSGSMLAALPDGQLRIDVAREVLIDLVTNQIPAGVPVALRVFGTTPDSCETSLLVPPAPLDPDAMAATIAAIEPVNLVRTPLGASLEQVADDLAGVDGPKVVILVTDGEETCGGDPAKAIRSLAGQGIDVQVNIVGFALDDDALRDRFSAWAALGNGTYFDATSADELDDAIGQAVQAPFQVVDVDGDIVASGTVGGNPVDVPPGTYTVVVLTDPERRIEDVVVEEDERTELDLADPDD